MILNEKNTFGNSNGINFHEKFLLWLLRRVLPRMPLKICTRIFSKNSSRNFSWDFHQKLLRGFPPEISARNSYSNSYGIPSRNYSTHSSGNFTVKFLLRFPPGISPEIPPRISHWNFSRDFHQEFLRIRLEFLPRINSTNFSKLLQEFLWRSSRMFFKVSPGFFSGISPGALQRFSNTSDFH